MTKNITGMFKNGAAAREALQQLDQMGFSEKQISVVATDDTAGHSFNIEKDSKVAEGTSIGATSGGLLGAIASGLIATGSMVIPGVNLVIAGPIIAAAAGTGVGAFVGGLAGALVGLGIPEYEVKRYEDEIKHGGVLVVVDEEDEERRELVEKLFMQNDALSVAA